VLREAGFEELWIQPAAGDAGGALGAALAAWHGHLGRPRAPGPGDAMRGALLGPTWDDDAIDEAIGRLGAVAHAPGEAALLAAVAERLAAGDVVGWFQGRMEFGPRALGSRSILADPRGPDMRDHLNRAIKFRESFRPFAPAVLAERAAGTFELDRESPYMLLVAPVVEAHRAALPAVTHVDGSARLQTVTAAGHPRLHALLAAFERRTGCPALVNTSFNVRGEPMVCSPEDAYRCFMATGMDLLVLGGRLLRKAEQPAPRPPAPPATGTGPGLARRLLAGLGRGWMALAGTLGRLNARLLFGAAWVLLVVPYGLAFRLLGRRPLRLGFDRAAASYRTDPRASPPGAMDRPW
jgi:carbamoyltransferase